LVVENSTSMALYNCQSAFSGKPLAITSYDESTSTAAPLLFDSLVAGPQNLLDVEVPPHFRTWLRCAHR
jgi:hypothetical protein